MKKIKINYDLITKINESKNGIQLCKFIKEGSIMCVSSLSLAALTLLFVNYSPKKIPIFFSSIIAVCTLTSFIRVYFDKEENPDAKIKYKGDIFELESKLSSELGIKSNLFKAKVIKRKYRFVDNDGKPGLKQEKLISAPLNDGGNCTLLQEHIIGSQDYEYSLTNNIEHKQSRAIL